MGPSDIESNQASLLMVSEHETRTNSDLRVHSPAAVDKLDVVTSGKRLKPSSSSSSSFSSFSPDSPLEHPFQEDDIEPDKPPLSTTMPPKSSIPKYEQSNNEVPISTLPRGFTDPTLELSSENEPTTVPPVTQVMEPSVDGSYRIPPSVFARTMSTAPVEWSTASNESLFSIQMGNMSFINDDFLWKSGELGMKSGELGMRSGELGMRSGELGMRSGQLLTPAEFSTSVQMFNYSQTPGTETTDSGKSRELGVAVEIMKEVLRECADDHKNEKSIAEGRITRHSDGSISTKSFAFSLGVEKGNSAKIGSSLKVAPENPQPNVQPQPTLEQEPKTPVATPEVAKTSWFSCLPCWPPLLRDIR